MGLRNRWNYSGYPYFVTTTVVEWADAFKDPSCLDIICKSLNFCSDKFDSRIIAYCIMPNHVHIVLWPPRDASISDFMRDFKKYTSVQVRRILELQGEKGLLETLRRNAKGGKGQIFKLWQSRFDDLVLTEAETLKLKIDYVHENPVRSGLVSKAEDWLYSSARDYLLDSPSPVRVDKDW